VQDEFAERSHHEEGEHAAERVGDEQGRSRGGEPAAGAQEEPRADGTSDGDHVDVPRLEGLAVALVTGINMSACRRLLADAASEGSFAHGP
jgi:hypothetical protein